MCHSWDLNSRYNVIIDKLIKNKSSKKVLTSLMQNVIIDY